MKKNNHLLVIAYSAAMTYGCCTSLKATEIRELFLQAWQQREVPARVAGVLAEVRVDKGRAVNQGDVLARIDDREQQIARERAELELHVARRHAESLAHKLKLRNQSLVVAVSAHNRALQSNENVRGSIPEDEIERLQLARDQAQFELSEAQHEHQVTLATTRLKENDLAAAKLVLNQRTITAPIDGDVVDVRARSGEWVEPGQPLIRILKIDPLIVEALVESNADIQELLGQTVSFVLDMEDHDPLPFLGTIDYVSPEVGAVDGQVLIRVRIDNSERRLRPGFKVRMIFDTPAPRMRSTNGRKA